MKVTLVYEIAETDETSLLRQMVRRPANGEELAYIQKNLLDQTPVALLVGDYYELYTTQKNKLDEIENILRKGA